MSETKQVSGQSYTFFRMRIYSDETRIIEYKRTGELISAHNPNKLNGWLIEKSRDISKFNDDELLELMRITS